MTKIVIGFKGTPLISLDYLLKHPLKVLKEIKKAKEEKPKDPK